MGSSCLGSRTQRGAFEAPARPGVSSPLLRSRLGGQLGGPAWDAVSMRERFPSLGRILEVGPMGPRVTPLGSPGEPGTVFRSRGPTLRPPSLLAQLSQCLNLRCRHPSGTCTGNCVAGGWQGASVSSMPCRKAGCPCTVVPIPVGSGFRAPSPRSHPDAHCALRVLRVGTEDRLWLVSLSQEAWMAVSPGSRFFSEAARVPGLSGGWLRDGPGCVCLVRGRAGARTWGSGRNPAPWRPQPTRGALPSHRAL